ncbi:hypothetical protein M5K25_006899 [Dendrobium thyrsiflorum]|uniref:Uncharacterized protein n=1 Tax=Dendrobium thyrsiflorum TaxID=117978 RepID=A0ABD0VCY8_DENTH
MGRPQQCLGQPILHKEEGADKYNRASDVRGLGSFLCTRGSVPRTEHSLRLLGESRAGAGEGSSGGSTDYSDYRIWSQEILEELQRMREHISGNQHVPISAEQESENIDSD